MEHSIDRQKVIKALEFCTSPKIVDTCYGECPYAVADDEYKCFEMKLDALALLKEQEPVKPIPPTDESEMWRCGNCHHQIFRCTHQQFCDKCGRAVKWE